MTLEQLISCDDMTLDRVHGYMHWLFPLRKPSNRYGGPTITEDELNEFRRDSELRKSYLATFKRMMSYFGFQFEKAGAGLRIVPSANASERQKVWLVANDLHLHSICRILQSLMLLEFQDVAKMFFNSLSELYKVNKSAIGDRNYRYWTQAVENKDYWNSST